MKHFHCLEISQSFFSILFRQHLTDKIPLQKNKQKKINIGIRCNTFDISWYWFITTTFTYNGMYFRMRCWDEAVTVYWPTDTERQLVDGFGSSIEDSCVWSLARTCWGKLGRPDRSVFHTLLEIRANNSSRNILFRSRWGDAYLSTLLERRTDCERDKGRRKWEDKGSVICEV